MTNLLYALIMKSAKLVPYVLVVPFHKFPRALFIWRWPIQSDLGFHQTWARIYGHL